MASPIRTCIGCRRRGPAAEMLRLAVKGGGRGASVHPSCVEQGMRPEVLSRAFKRPLVAADVDVRQSQHSRRKRLETP